VGGKYVSTTSLYTAVISSHIETKIASHNTGVENKQVAVLIYFDFGLLLSEAILYP
jgi:hypothetical protein